MSEKIIKVRETVRTLGRRWEIVGYDVFFGGKWMEQFNLGDVRSLKEAEEFAEQRRPEYEARMAEPTEPTDPRQQDWE